MKYEKNLCQFALQAINCNIKVGLTLFNVNDEVWNARYVNRYRDDHLNS